MILTFSSEQSAFIRMTTPIPPTNSAWLVNNNSCTSCKLHFAQRWWPHQSDKLLSDSKPLDLLSRSMDLGRFPSPFTILELDTTPIWLVTHPYHYQSPFCLCYKSSTSTLMLCMQLHIASFTIPMLCMQLLIASYYISDTFACNST